jgi:hypothetical protein
MAALSNSLAAALLVSSVAAAPGASPRATSASDFEVRKSAPGVVRWFDFDSDAQLGSKAYGSNFGVLKGDKTSPVIDKTVKASGAGSLRFDLESYTASNGAGAWYANFSKDLSVQFGENSEFYVQWRQRFNRAFVDTYFTEDWGDGKIHPQGGTKQIIVTTGDQPKRIFNSCEAIEVVVTTYYQQRLPIAYNSCTGSTSHPAYSPFYEKLPAADFRLQNGTAPYCLYSNSGDDKTGVGPGCFGWVPDEWMTFQIGVTLGPRDNSKGEFLESRVRLWGAREGQRSVLLVDWKPGIPGYFPLTAGPATDNQRFGKVWLLPYMTNKNHKQAHPLAQTWYDDLIISTQRIADPAR